MDKENRKMATERDDDRARGEVSPEGTEGPPWGGWGWSSPGSAGMPSAWLACLQTGYPLCRPGAHFPGLISTFAAVAANAGRGLSLRMDHGTQYLSDHFHKQIKYWGINPSFAFIEQPQTNRVAERFIGTLKEQVIYGRVFQNLQEVREEVRHFEDTYNREWLVEKNGFQSPWQAGAQWHAQASLPRAA